MHMVCVRMVHDCRMTVSMTHRSLCMSGADDLETANCVKVDQVASMLQAAKSIVIVPGYGNVRGMTACDDST